MFKIRGVDFSLNASSIDYFLYLYLHVYRAASHLAIKSQTMLTGFIYRILLVSNLIEDGTVQCKVE